MKRMLSIVMALVLVLSLGTVAFADETETKWDGNYTATTQTTFNIKKSYNIEGDVTITETLNFVSTPANTNPDYATGEDGSVADSVANLSVAALTVNTMTKNQNSGKHEADITVTVPSYSKAGVYDYTITETAGTATGATYSNAKIKVQVLVEYDNENHKLVIGNPKGTGNDSGITYFIVRENNTKTDTFENSYKTGSFSVAKDVAGNMANENDEFEITVTLTAPENKTINAPIKVGGNDVAASEWKSSTSDDGKTTYTYTKTLSISENDDATTFADIPVGVVVTVAENTNTDKMNGYTYAGISVDKGDVKKTGESLDQSYTFTINDNTNSAIVVKNEKETSVETGISMDTLPYVLLLAVACMGIIAVVSKKRLARER